MPERQTNNQLPQTWSLFQQTYILTSRFFESVAERAGLSYPQAAVLNVLRLHDQPLPLSRVARLLTQEAQSTTELADRLERRGLVRRVRDQRDRRLVLLELTDEGRAVIDQIAPALQDAAAQLFGTLDAEQLGRLLTLLRSLRDSAADRLGVDRARLQAAVTGFSSNGP